MKNYNLIIVLFSSFLLMGCPNSDDGEITESFNPVTLDFTNLNVTENDTSFEVKGYTFNNFGSKASNNFSVTDNGVRTEFDVMLLWHDGTNLHYIELPLDDSKDISKITARVFSNGTIAKATLFNSDIIVEEKESTGGFTDFIFNLKNKSFNKLRLISAEGAAVSIKLE